MGEFFIGWRRKVGIVTLLLASVFAGSWVRNRYEYDEFLIPRGRSAYGVASMGDGLNFYRFVSRPGESAWNFYMFDSIDAWKSNREEIPWSGKDELFWRWDWAGFHFGESRVGSRRDLNCMIPYWFLVVPSTMLSAYLLVAKPRTFAKEKTAGRMSSTTGDDSAIRRAAV